MHQFYAKARKSVTKTSRLPITWPDSFRTLLIEISIYDKLINIKKQLKRFFLSGHHLLISQRTLKPPSAKNSKHKIDAYR